MKRLLCAVLVGVCACAGHGSPGIMGALRDAGLVRDGGVSPAAREVVRAARSGELPGFRVRRGAWVSRFVVGREAVRARQEWAGTVDRLGKMLTLAEELLDTDALGEEEGDLVAEALVSALPVRAAEGLTLLAASYESEDAALAERFARLALGVLDGVAAESVRADLVRGHALRLAGEHAGAARAYNAVLLATDGAGWEDHDAMDARGAALLGSVRAIAALGGDTAGLMDGVLGEAPFVEPERSRWEWHLWLEWRQIAAGAEYDLARARGMGIDDAVAPYMELLRHVRTPYKAFSGLYQPMAGALARIGAEAGGLAAADRMPLVCLHALTIGAADRSIGMGADRYALARRAWLRADAMGPERTPLWSSCGAAYAEALFADAVVQPDGWYAEAGGALVRVMERERELGGVARTVWNAIARGLLSDAQTERVVVVIEGERGGLRGSRERWINTAYMTALVRGLSRVEPGGDAWERTIARGEALYASEHNASALGGLVRLRTTASRLGAFEDRRVHAERVVGLIGALRESEGDSGASRATSEGMPGLTWRLDAADALMVVGDFERAREMLSHVVRRRPVAEAYERSRVRLLGHLELLEGNEREAAAWFERLIDDPGAELLPGAPFVPDDEGAEALIGTFLADAGAPSERDEMEARYAWVRVRLEPDLSGFDADPRLHGRAARLIRAGWADRAIRVVALTNGSTPTAGVLMGEAHLRAGDDAPAFASFRGVASSLEGTREGRSERAYWHAWARMLEILERQNGDGSRTGEIDGTVRRLRALSSWGMHADCVEKIEGVAGRVGR
ncbi:MAG: hypothetical protein AAGH64_04660 [Planctomycetota bacterium]